MTNAEPENSHSRVQNTHIELLRNRRSQSTTGLVRDAIEALILNGDIIPGSHLSENKLVKLLDVSRGPIREACRALVESGLLIAEANRGFFVRRLTLKEVMGVYEVRTSLARLSGSKAATGTTTVQVGQLGAMVEKMDACAESGDSETFYRLNLEFHDLINEFSGNATLVDIQKILVRDLILFRRRGLTSSARLQESNAEHRRIVRAIASQDPGAAADEMETHILRGKERFLSATDGNLG